MSRVQGLLNNLSIKQAQLWDIQDLSCWAAPLKIPSLLFQSHQLLVPPGEPALSCGVCLNLLRRSRLFSYTRAMWHLGEIHHIWNRFYSSYRSRFHHRSVGANILWQGKRRQVFDVVPAGPRSSGCDASAGWWMFGCLRGLLHLPDF